jgi:Tfp pilus assembly protein PilF
MSDLKAKKIEQAQLIQAIKDANNEGSSVHYGFILGAGASVTSGIPSGGKLASKWYEEIKDSILQTTLSKWQESIADFDEDNLAASYTKIFKKRFEVDYHLGYQELQRYMDKAKPSIGYSFLAQVLDKTANKFVITTNFDTMTEDALFELGNAKPLVLGHEVLSKFINATSPTRPTIIKIHRDFLFDPYNTDEEIEELDNQWQESLEPVLTENSMIVLGYGGNDESLMNYLKNIQNRKPIYWCYREEYELSDKIKELLGKQDFVIQITSFDKFMLLVSDKLGFEPLVDKENIENSEIIQNARENAKSYAKQLEELVKEELNTKETEAIKKLLPSWWDYELAAREEADIDKKDKIYQDGLKAHPNSHELHGNYANFLWQIRKEYKKAEKYYKKALELEPNHADYNGNYANFLTLIQKEYDKAEKYYIKALEIKPNDADYNGNYANFLTLIRKDYENAEKYYEKALEIEPNHANNNGNYAQFLLIQGKKEEARKYIEIAFENLTFEEDLPVELWFYRLAHYDEYHQEAQQRLDELLDAGYRSIGWNLEDNIKRAEQDGFEDIKLLRAYANMITKE